jgi:predicted phosphodiesterase
VRTAIISDIHGHLEGLTLVLQDVESRNCQRTLCLGDLVEGGSCDEEVVNTIRRLNIPCARGNHDEANPLNLKSELQDFLTALPAQIAEDDVLYCHISPRDKMLKINKKIEAWNVFDETPERLIFTGHQHVPFIYGETSDSFGEATLHDFEYNEPFVLDPDDRYIICVGSVAYGRDPVGKLRYAIFDSEAQTVEHRTVDGPLLDKDYTVRLRLSFPQTKLAKDSVENFLSDVQP